MAFTKLSKALHPPRLHGSGNERYTDKNEFLSPGVLIAFKARAAGGYPTDPMKDAVNRAAIQARNIVRIANDVMAKVVIMRKDETPNFTATMARHFNLIAGNLAGGYLADNVVNKPFSPKAVFRSDPAVGFGKDSAEDAFAQLSSEHRGVPVRHGYGCSHGSRRHSDRGGDLDRRGWLCVSAWRPEWVRGPELRIQERGGSHRLQ